MADTETLVGNTETNKVLYDAKRNGVSSVTVFQSNRAEVSLAHYFSSFRTRLTLNPQKKVKRKIEVALKEGQNDVEITHLPSCLEESSIRVDGIGNATIFDVIYREY